MKKSKTKNFIILNENTKERVIIPKNKLNNEELMFIKELFTKKSKGIMLHTCLAVSGDEAVLGVLGQSQDSRTERSHAPAER